MYRRQSRTMRIIVIIVAGLMILSLALASGPIPVSPN
jgi:hypothetical protein